MAGDLEINETNAAQKFAASLQQLNQDIDTGKTVGSYSEPKRGFLSARHD